MRNNRNRPNGLPPETFTCDESAGLDVITVAESTYDPEAVYITASEYNTAGVMTHHIGFFMTPGKAVRLAKRILDEAISKTKGNG